MAEELPRTFAWADYLVFGVLMLVCTLIGLIQGIRDRWGTRPKDDEDSAPGEEKDMKLVPVIWSIVATSFSSNFVLGFPAEMYFLGTEFGVACVGFAIGFPTSIVLFVKKFYELGIPSVFEYIGLRFGKELKAALVILYGFSMLLYMGLIIYAPALAFSESSSIPIWAALLLTGIICMLYTTLGGLKGVLWIDTLQMLIVLGIGLSNCALGTSKVGGLGRVWDLAENGSRIDWPSWSFDPTIRHSFWSTTVGGVAVIWLLVTNQAVTQKFLGLPNLKQVYIAGGFYMLAVELFCCVYMMSGIVMYAYYRTVSCEPMSSGEIDRPDQLVPYFVLEIYEKYPGIAGMFTSAVFGASLSTVSAGINALAAMSMRDIVFPIYKKRGSLPSLTKRVAIFKGLSVVWGVLSLAVAFLAPLMGRSVLQIGLSILSLASGPIVGVLVLGMYVPFAEKIGAFCGVILAIIFEFAVMIGATVVGVQPTPKPLAAGVCPMSNTTTTATTTTATTASVMGDDGTSEASGLFRISYLLYSPFGILITIGVTMIVSVGVRMFKRQLLWPEVDTKLLHLPTKAKLAGMGDVTGTTDINGDGPKADAKDSVSKVKGKDASKAKQGHSRESGSKAKVKPEPRDEVQTYTNPAYETDKATRM